MHVCVEQSQCEVGQSSLACTFPAELPAEGCTDSHSVVHKSIKTILVCSGGQIEREESFDVNPLDRDGKITLCPSDVILDVTCQIIL